MRVQNEGNGKSSWWVINPDAKGAKTSRRRANSLESGQKTTEKKRGRKKDKFREESDRPGSPRLSVVRARDINRSNSPGNTSPTSSSSDSLLTVPELVEYEQNSPLPFPLNDSFGRPRTSSNASNVSSIGRLSPIPSQDDDEGEIQDSVSPMHHNMASTPNPAAEELTNMMAETMNLESYHLDNRTRIRPRENVSPVSNLLSHNERTQAETMNLSSMNLTNGYDGRYIQNQHRAPAISVQSQPNFNSLGITRRQQYPNGYGQQDLMSYVRDTEMDVHTPLTVFQPNYQNTCTTSCTMNQNDIPAPMDSYDLYLQSLVANTSVPSNNTFNSISQNGIHGQLQGNQQQQHRNSSNCNGNLQSIREKFPSDLELDAFKEGLECDMDTIITNELTIGDGFDFDFEQLAPSPMMSTPVTVGELTGRLF